jgi:hypothetical protein
MYDWSLLDKHDVWLVIAGQTWYVIGHCWTNMICDWSLLDQHDEWPITHHVGPAMTNHTSCWSSNDQSHIMFVQQWPITHHVCPAMTNHTSCGQTWYVIGHCWTNMMCDWLLLDQHDVWLVIAGQTWCVIGHCWTNMITTTMKGEPKTDSQMTTIISVTMDHNHDNNERRTKNWLPDDNKHTTHYGSQPRLVCLLSSGNQFLVLLSLLSWLWSIVTGMIVVIWLSVFHSPW